MDGVPIQSRTTGTDYVDADEAAYQTDATFPDESKKENRDHLNFHLNCLPNCPCGSDGLAIAGGERSVKVEDPWPD